MIFNKELENDINELTNNMNFLNSSIEEKYMSYFNTNKEHKDFLNSHPMNISNGGNLFQIEDKKIEAEQTLNREFLLNDAITLVRDKDIQELLPIAIYFGININTPVSEIRYNLLTTAKKNPQEFISSFNDPKVKTRSILQQAADYNIIKVKADGVYWLDSNGLIVSN